jgi:hypothetical protein
MRLRGVTYREIGESLDPPRSIGSVKTKLDNEGIVYVKPRKPAPVISRAVETMERNNRNQTRSDRRRNALMMITDHADENETKEYPSRWPVGKEAITDPDEALRHARLLIAGHIQALAKGALYERIPTDVTLAIYIWTHSMPYWDTDWLRKNRSRWGAIRELARVGIDEAGRRCSVSGSSISRYESLNRVPEAAILGRLFVLYGSLQEEALQRQEKYLAFLSYIDADPAHTIEHSNNGDAPEPGIATEHFFRWIDDGKNPWMSDSDIAHISYLHRARSLIRRPAWRPEEPSAFYLLGYADPREQKESPA